MSRCARATCRQSGWPPGWVHAGDGTIALSTEAIRAPTSLLYNRHVYLYGSSPWRLIYTQNDDIYLSITLKCYAA